MDILGILQYYFIPLGILTLDLKQLFERLTTIKVFSPRTTPDCPGPWFGVVLGDPEYPVLFWDSWDWGFTMFQGLRTFLGLG